MVSLTKMTKTQVKNALDSIHSKSFKLLGATGNFPAVLTVADYSAINKIITKAKNRLK